MSSDSRPFYKRTLVGRVVYDRPHHGFTWRDVSRIIRDQPASDIDSVAFINQLVAWLRLTLRMVISVIWTPRRFIDEIRRWPGAYTVVVWLARIIIRDEQGEVPDPAPEQLDLDTEV